MPKVILVVDDDDLVRETAVVLIESLGYGAVSVANAQDALRLVMDDGIDAVLTDIMMPGIDGLELAKRIHELEPRLPVICTTGYANVVENSRHYDALLRKPYHVATIAKTLKSVLAAD
jgi:CheY-like chemotaxis protein